MIRFSRRKILSVGTALAVASVPVAAAEEWIEGRHFHRVGGDAPTPVTGPVAITEIFSYGCSGCNSFLPYMQALEKRAASSGVAVKYLHASWLAAENWPALQRAHITAKALGVDKQTHEAMFEAIWRTGELAVVNARTGRPKSPLPSMGEIASFYQRAGGVPVAKFLEASKSFAVDSEIRRTDNAIKTFRASSTPTLIVNDRYRVDGASAGSYPHMTEISLWLAQREHGRKTAARP